MASNIEILDAISDVILEAKIYGMNEQENPLGYADSNDLDQAISKLLEVIGLKADVRNGDIFYGKYKE